MEESQAVLNENLYVSAAVQYKQPKAASLQVGLKCIYVQAFIPLTLCIIILQKRSDNAMEYAEPYEVCSK